LFFGVSSFSFQGGSVSFPFLFGWLGSGMVWIWLHHHQWRIVFPLFSFSVDVPAWG
jgi:hypothetical protein